MARRCDCELHLTAADGRLATLVRRASPARVSYAQSLSSDHSLLHEPRLLRLLVEGHNYRTAAAELGVSINTVCFHIKQAYGKLHVHLKSEAVAKALRRRLIQ